MNDIEIKKQVIKQLEVSKLLPELPSFLENTIPCIHKVEWDLTFNCNDSCEHCVTDSGPCRKESTLFSDANKIIENIRQYNLLDSYKKIYPHIKFEKTQKFIEMENLSTPPELNDETILNYINCLHGREHVGYNFHTKQSIPFSRGHIRLSGGEFFMWPCKETQLSIEERLQFQNKLIKNIRKKLPEYDLWVLTNGRFAESQKTSDQVIQSWSEHANNNNQGRLRICISYDPFHHAPKNSTKKKMLNRIWKSCKKYNISSPFIYSIPNKEIYLAGKLIEKYKPGDCLKGFKIIENDLKITDGCGEVKGFVVPVKNNQILLANNINISPQGNLTFCCAQVGNYGDFINNPQKTLNAIITNPFSKMLRNSKTTENLFKTILNVDPSIRLFDNVENSLMNGATCYQFLSGKRI